MKIKFIFMYIAPRTLADNTMGSVLYININRLPIWSFSQTNLPLNDFVIVFSFNNINEYVTRFALSVNYVKVKFTKFQDHRTFSFGEDF